MEHKKLAAIDIGTNSIHLVVADAKSDGSFEVIGSEKDSVRLGSGGLDMDRITEEAMERGVHAIKHFVKIAQGMDAKIRAVATSAVREARNREHFLKQLNDECGLSVEVIPGHEEARLIYLGVIQALPISDQDLLVIDIGGGSTEFVTGRGGVTSYQTSLKLGAIRLSDRFFSEEPIRRANIDECRKYIQVTMNGLVMDMKNHTWKTAVGSSGTIETIFKMIQNASNKNRVVWDEAILTRKDLDKVVAQILSFPTAEKRVQLTGLDLKRADIIVGGALLLQEIFKALNIDKMIFSPFALREGVVVDTLMREYEITTKVSDIRRRSVMNLLEIHSFRNGAAIGAGVHCSQLSLEIYDQLIKLDILKPENENGENERYLLEMGAYLHNIGLSISHSAHHKHSYYIIKNSEQLLGFTKLEIEMIALIARYHRKAVPSSSHLEFTTLPLRQQKSLLRLASILRIAVGLNRGFNKEVEKVTLRKEGDSLLFELKPPEQGEVDPKSLSLEIWSADLKKALFEKTFGVKVKFIPID